MPRPEGLTPGLLELLFRRAASQGFAGEMWFSVPRGTGEGAPRLAGHGWTPRFIRRLAEGRGFSAAVAEGRHSVLVRVKAP